MILKILLFVVYIGLVKSDESEDPIDILLKYIKSSADPCDDFYEYACGKWAKYNPIPSQKLTYDEVDRITEDLTFIIKDLLEFEEVFDEKTSMSAETKARTMYVSCMNEELIDRRNDKPLLNYINSIGGWYIFHSNPIKICLKESFGFENSDKSNKFIHNQNSTDPKWIELIGHARLLEIRVILDFYVYENPKNTSENILYIEEPDELSIDFDYYLKDEFSYKLNTYRHYVRIILELLGADRSKTNQIASNIVDFEIELAKIRTKHTDEFDRYNRVTLQEVSNLFPEIEWQSAQSIIHGKKIDMNQPVLLMGKKYIERLVPVLENAGSEIVSNYIFWRIIAKTVGFLDHRFLDANYQFEKIIKGPKISDPLWVKCAKLVNNRMGMAVASMYVRKYFSNESVNDLNEISNDIRMAFQQSFEKAKWHDNETKVNVTRKLENMKITFGFPQFILTPEILNEKYSDLNVDAGKYFENIINSFRLEAREQQKKLGKKVDRLEWEPYMKPVDVQARFHDLRNSINFPVGLLQTPFYEIEFPPFRKYGAIGSVIAHEISHGFDSAGRTYNYDGNMQPWWNNEDIKDYNNKLDCYETQYSNYKVLGKSIKVDRQFLEIIADNLGLKHSFIAFKNWRKEFAEVADYSEFEPISEDELLVEDQAFFTSFAQMLCQSYKPEAIDTILDNEHPPGKIRINGAVSNLKGFATAFNCAIDAPMNRVNKCNIW